MAKYKLLKDDITIIEIENKNFVIDTGIPFSFCYEEENDIAIESQTYHLNKNDLLSDVFRNLDIKVDGIIGLDIIGKQKGLTIDKEKRIFMFEPQKRKASICKKLNNLCVSATINKTFVNNVYLDTAAINDIISNKFSKGLEVIKTIKQTTTLGNIDFDVCNVEIELLNKKKVTETLILPNRLNDQIPFGGIINPNKYYQKYLSFNFKTNEIYFE